MYNNKMIGGQCDQIGNNVIWYAILIAGVTPGKNNLFRKSNARANGLHHENGFAKSSSQLQGEHCKC